MNVVRVFPNTVYKMDMKMKIKKRFILVQASSAA